MKYNTLRNTLTAYICLQTIVMYAAHLDELALFYKTDKASSGHNYTSVYEKYFSPIQNKPLKILEIGFSNGCSARLWDAYFTDSATKIYFIDNEPSCYDRMHGLSHRCLLYMADQADAAQLQEFVKEHGGDFDMIIDDGGHTMDQQIISFQTLFPYVKKGGMYIIEDLHTSYWKEWGSLGSLDNPQSSKHSAINFLRNLIHDLNFIGACSGTANRSKKESLNKKLTIYQSAIASMHFYTSLCFIFKDS